MRSLIVGLLAVSMLAGCVHSTMVTRHTSVRTVDGSMGYHVTTPYGGWPEDSATARVKAVEKLDYYSNGLCENGYTKTGEQESPFVSRLGLGHRTGGKVKNLSWEIKCNNPEQPAS